MISTIIKCITGPRLFRMYKNDAQLGRDYVANPLETFGDMVLLWFRFCWSVSYWGCPVVLTVLYRKGVFTTSGLLTFASYSTNFALIIAAALFVRTIGRYSNKDYRSFLRVLIAAHENNNADSKKKLRGYDFEFRSWPVDFKARQQKKKQESILSQVLSISRTSFMLPNRNNVVDSLKGLPCQIFSYVSAHTFGIRMVYPGKTALINTLVGPPLLVGRTKLIEEKNGLRAKVKAEDGNEIDTMFVDRRNDPKFSENGNVLAICCEGNSGFYEIGCTVTPLEAGYSVLGWNHPGFAGSSGMPFPASEQAAVDGVLQYATNELSFQPQNIVLFAWSIGGYAASWAATQYPEIKYVVLDATFDDLLPLALARMPQSLENLVHLTIRKYINLHISSLLTKYPGPVLLIRRSRDEMITTIDPTVISSNRGNDLLLKLLQQRYPKIVDEESSPLIRTYLCKSLVADQIEYFMSHNVDDSYCESLMSSYIEDNADEGLPMQYEPPVKEKNQLALYLAKKYMYDFDATHCVPLPARLFLKPWSV